LIIISVQLDDIDGLQICERLRNEGIPTPILFLSTNANQENCSCISNIAILIKPFSLDTLFSKVEKLLSNEVDFK
jgi:DNA-binding response OmpR family regulator